MHPLSTLILHHVLTDNRRMTRQHNASCQLLLTVEAQCNENNNWSEAVSDRLWCWTEAICSCRALVRPPSASVSEPSSVLSSSSIHAALLIGLSYSTTSTLISSTSRKRHQSMKQVFPRINISITFSTPKHGTGRPHITLSTLVIWHHSDTLEHGTGLSCITVTF